jgi:hypothetical protein
MIDANKIAKLFGDKGRKGQEIFPKLLEKLINASVDVSATVRFPSGDLISTDGFDGIVNSVVSSNNANIPLGNSVWELGTGKDYKGKVNQDYLKRSEDTVSFEKSDYTFVLCTTHVWNGKPGILEWTTERNNQSVWKEVRIIDAVVLDGWIAQNPAIAIWLLEEFGEQPKGQLDLSNFQTEYNYVCSLTEPKFNDKIFTVGNEEIVTKLSALLHESQRINSIYSPINFEQGLFFCYGAIEKIGNQQLKDKIIVVKNQETLSYVEREFRKKLIIVANQGIRYNSELKNNRPVLKPQICVV